MYAVTAAAASTVAGIVVLLGAGRAQTRKVFSLCCTTLTHTHIYMAAPTPTCSIHSTAYALLFFPHFGYVCVLTWQGFLHLASRPSKRSRAFLDGSRPASADRVVTYPVPPPLHTRTCRDFKSDFVSIRLRNNVKWNSFRHFQIFQIFKVRAFFKNLVDFDFMAGRQQP